MIEPWQTMLSSASPRRPSAPLFAEHELRRRQIRLIGADRPVIVVQVEQRIDRDQIDVRFVVGVERADVAPVGVSLAVLVVERKREHRCVSMIDGMMLRPKSCALSGCVASWQSCSNRNRAVKT